MSLSLSALHVAHTRTVRPKSAATATKPRAKRDKWAVPELPPLPAVAYRGKVEEEKAEKGKRPMSSPAFISLERGRGVELRKEKGSEDNGAVVEDVARNEDGEVVTNEVDMETREEGIDGGASAEVVEEIAPSPQVDEGIEIPNDGTTADTIPPSESPLEETLRDHTPSTAQRHKIPTRKPVATDDFTGFDQLTSMLQSPSKRETSTPAPPPPEPTSAPPIESSDPDTTLPQPPISTQPTDEDLTHLLHTLLSAHTSYLSEPSRRRLDQIHARHAHTVAKFPDLLRVLHWADRQNPTIDNFGEAEAKGVLIINGVREGAGAGPGGRWVRTSHGSRGGSGREERLKGFNAGVRVGVGVTVRKVALSAGGGRRM
ncbi:hypothetical protein HDV00_002995 [Rhizophlyctis rosea]|nr:hypothetical protein HDV00_002995 [Rhizophlyctis rosea]